MLHGVPMRRVVDCKQRFSNRRRVSRQIRMMLLERRRARLHRAVAGEDATLA